MQDSDTRELASARMRTTCDGGGAFVHVVKLMETTGAEPVRSVHGHFYIETHGKQLGPEIGAWSEYRHSPVLAWAIAIEHLNAAIEHAERTTR